MLKRSQVLVASLVLAFGCDKPAAPDAVKPQDAFCGDHDPSEKIPDAWLRCETDEECVRGHDDCCGCSGGSDGVAISRAYAKCIEVDCSKPGTCIAEEACLDTQVVCSDGLCALAPLAAAPAPPVDAQDCAGYQPGSAEVPPALLACSSDEECVLAEYECCPCSANGDRVAVAKAHAACIKPTGCDAMMRCADAYVCDDYAVGCSEGTCVRIDKSVLLEDVID